jgi:hypothetical protein
MNIYQIEYLTIWKVAFRGLLGWSEKQTVHWAQPLLEGLDAPGIALNEPPLYYVARELVNCRPYTERLPGAQRDMLVREVEGVLSANNRLRGFPPGFQFEDVSRDLNALLESLDTVERRLARASPMIEEYEHYYSRVWKACLSRLAGWPDGKISEFVGALRQRLAKNFEEFSKKPPAFWIGEVLIPERLQQLLNASELDELKQKLVKIVEENNGLWLDDTSCDWGKVRDAMSKVFAEFAEKKIS